VGACTLPARWGLPARTAHLPHHSLFGADRPPQAGRPPAHLPPRFTCTQIYLSTLSSWRCLHPTCTLFSGTSPLFFAGVFTHHTTSFYHLTGVEVHSGREVTGVIFTPALHCTPLHSDPSVHTGSAHRKRLWEHPLCTCTHLRRALPAPHHTSRPAPTTWGPFSNLCHLSHLLQRLGRPHTSGRHTTPFWRQVGRWGGGWKAFTEAFPLWTSSTSLLPDHTLPFRYTPLSMTDFPTHHPTTCHILDAHHTPQAEVGPSLLPSFPHHYLCTPVKGGGEAVVPGHSTLHT